MILKVADALKSLRRTYPDNVVNRDLHKLKFAYPDDSVGRDVHK